MVVMACAVCAMLTAWIIAAAPAMNADQARVRVLVGQTRPMGDGTIRSWVRVDAQNRPMAMGVTFTEAALSNLPTTAGHGRCCGGHEYSLALPAETTTAPFKHIVVNWNPSGHEPEQIYGLPHFDFHFYTIDESTRTSIRAKDDDMARCTAAPSAAYLPKGYMQAPGAVPRMGAHWIDPTSPEFNGQIFTRTFIYGSYDGQIAFVEPMMTKAYIESRRNELIMIKQPQKSPMSGGFFPKQYRVKYDPATREYTVSLEGLTER
jgi:hypothetical protein